MEAEGGHYDMQIKRAAGQGRALSCGNERVVAKGGNIMCKLKGQMEKTGHYDVQIKRTDGRGRAL